MSTWRNRLSEFRSEKAAGARSWFGGRGPRQAWIRLALLAAALALQAALLVQPAPAAPTASRSVDGFLTFHLRLNSLQPPAVTVTEGRYVIRVVNGLVIGDVSVQIEDAQHSRLADSQVRKQAPKFSGFVDLKPGTYTVRVVGKPQWCSTITVTKKDGN